MKSLRTTMKQLLALFLFIGLSIGSANAQYQENDMTNERLHTLLVKQTPFLDGEYGSWHFIYGDRIMMVVTDESVNRLRIFSVIMEDNQLTEVQMRKMLEANFHSALDAKYSLFEGYVISVFTHPLKEINKSQLNDALLQVATLAQNFGKSYSSSELSKTEIKEETEEEIEMEEEIKMNKSPSRS